MNARHPLPIARTHRCAWLGMGVHRAFAVAGGLDDGGFGLVVVDAGNPRRRVDAISAHPRAL